MLVGLFTLKCSLFAIAMLIIKVEVLIVDKMPPTLFTSTEH